MSANQLEVIKTSVLGNGTLTNKLEKNNSFKMDIQRELGFAFQAFQANEYLQKATPESIQKAVTNVVLTGLTLNPVLQQACLVPRKKDNAVECCLEPMYQGLITKMIDTGQAKDVYAHVVYAADKLNVLMGSKKVLEHVPYYFLGVKEEDKGDEIGAYAVAILPDGTSKWEFVPIERVNEIMKTSESYKAEMAGRIKSSIWTGPHRAEMIKKTAIKALWKVMPKSDFSERVAKILEIDNETHQFTQPQEMSQKTFVTASQNPTIPAPAPVVVDTKTTEKRDSVAKNADKVAKKAADLNKEEPQATGNDSSKNKYGIQYSLKIQDVVNQLKELDLYGKLEKWVDLNSTHESIDEFLINASETELNDALNSI